VDCSIVINNNPPRSPSAANQQESSPRGVNVKIGDKQTVLVDTVNARYV
jgi:hypothetical protein